MRLRQQGHKQYYIEVVRAWVLMSDQAHMEIGETLVGRGRRAGHFLEQSGLCLLAIQLCAPPLKAWMAGRQHASGCRGGREGGRARTAVVDALGSSICFAVEFHVMSSPLPCVCVYGVPPGLASLFGKGRSAMTPGDLKTPHGFNLFLKHKLGKFVALQREQDRAQAVCQSGSNGNAAVAARHRQQLHQLITRSKEYLAKVIVLFETCGKHHDFARVGMQVLFAELLNPAHEISLQAAGIEILGKEGGVGRGSGSGAELPVRS